MKERRIYLYIMPHIQSVLSFSFVQQAIKTGKILCIHCINSAVIYMNHINDKTNEQILSHRVRSETFLSRCLCVDQVLTLLLWFAFQAVWQPWKVKNANEQNRKIRFLSFGLSIRSNAMWHGNRVCIFVRRKWNCKHETMRRRITLLCVASDWRSCTA